VTARRSTRRGRRAEGPELVGDEVRRELSRFGPQAGMAELLRAWPAAVGVPSAHNAWPARFQRDGTLVVHTVDSVWAYELGQLEPTIKARLGGLVPGRIRFVPGFLPDVLPDPERGREPPPEPSREALEEAARLAAGIADGDLRNLVQKAAALGLARAASSRGFW
jgi:Dna[CI] antecedent, DciA